MIVCSGDQMNNNNVYHAKETKPTAIQKLVLSSC